MHPFRDDRRSKSIEEREEEYQRVRERIFAHDVSSCFNCLFSAVLPQTASWQDSGSWSQGQIESSTPEVFLEEDLVQGSDGKGARGCVPS